MSAASPAEPDISNDLQLLESPTNLGSETGDNFSTASSGRKPVKTNPIRNEFRASHRGAENPKKIFGNMLSIGKAYSLMGINVTGSNFGVNEKKEHPTRVAIFDSAAPFCLDPDEIERIKLCPPQVYRELIENLHISQS